MCLHIVVIVSLLALALTLIAFAVDVNERDYECASKSEKQLLLEIIIEKRILLNGIAANGESLEGGELVHCLRGHQTGLFDLRGFLHVHSWH